MFTVFPRLSAIRLSRLVETSLLTAILLAFLLVSLALLSQKGLFIDDSMHIPAGYSYLLTHDYRLNQEHPPLIKLLSGLGVWELHPQFPFASPGWQQAATPQDPEDGMVKIEEAFFETNAKQFDQIAFYGRVPVLIIPLLLLLSVWWFTRELLGPIPALIATFLIATEPNIIGNAIVVQNDVASSLALLWFVMAVRKFFTSHAVRDALLFGAALGIALVTKYSLIVLVPVALVILLIRVTLELRRKRSSLTYVVLTSLLVLVTAYVILIAFYAFHVDRFLLPRYFIYGIEMVIQDTREGRPAFLLGQVSDTGWWYYFPVAFSLKTTVVFLISSIGGLVWAVFQVLKHKRYALLYLLLPAVLYLGITMTSHLNIGVRHLLPMFPFVAILGAGFISAVIHYVLMRSRSLAVVFGIIVMVLALAITISTFPNYLTYFSPLAGGTDRGWQKLSDSNVETGQEVKPLAKYLKAHGQNRVTGIMVGGEFLRFYGVRLDDFPQWYDDDESGESGESGDEDAEDQNDVTKVDTEYVAVGAWYLSEIDLTDKQKEIIDVYRQKKPEAMVGGSIFVFRR